MLTDIALYLSCAVLAAMFLLAWVWLVVFVAGHAWHCAKERANRAPAPPAKPAPALDTTMMFGPANDRQFAERPLTNQRQPGRDVAPLAGGVCVLGHYVMPRHAACYKGHRLNRERTAQTPPTGLDAARAEMHKHEPIAADVAAERAAGAPW